MKPPPVARPAWQWTARACFTLPRFMGFQVCDAQGRVITIFNRPDQADPSLGPVSGVAFGGADYHYLYAVIGNEFTAGLRA